MAFVTSHLPANSINKVAALTLAHKCWQTHSECEAAVKNKLKTNLNTQLQLFAIFGLYTEICIAFY